MIYDGRPALRWCITIICQQCNGALIVLNNRSTSLGPREKERPGQKPNPDKDCLIPLKCCVLSKNWEVGTSIQQEAPEALGSFVLILWGEELAFLTAPKSGLNVSKGRRFLSYLGEAKDTPSKCIPLQANYRKGKIFIRYLSGSTFQPNAPESEDRPSAGTGTYLPFISVLPYSLWVRMQPALTVSHCTCAAHHQHWCNIVYSVMDTRGMCSQPGPLGAPIIQAMKGSPCQRNTRVSIDSKPKPSTLFCISTPSWGKCTWQYISIPYYSCLISHLSALVHIGAIEHRSEDGTRQWWVASISNYAGLFLCNTVSLMEGYLVQIYGYHSVVNNA